MLLECGQFKGRCAAATLLGTPHLFANASQCNHIVIIHGVIVPSKSAITFLSHVAKPASPMHHIDKCQAA